MHVLESQHRLYFTCCVISLTQGKNIFDSFKKILSGTWGGGIWVLFLAMLYIDSEGREKAKGSMLSSEMKFGLNLHFFEEYHPGSARWSKIQMRGLNQDFYFPVICSVNDFAPLSVPELFIYSGILYFMFILFMVGLHSLLSLLLFHLMLINLE